ncbi:MAG TPA: hypothetical protein DCR17_16545, partial [Verrucomicrobiales bacterium]|nr:hypothetical protein [Verrucomicrobiales bacterium]
MKYQTLLVLLLAFIFTGCGPSAPKISIHEAVERGDIKTLKEHLEFGTDINAKKDGMTSLHAAVWFGHIELAKLLISEGADVDAKSDGSIFQLPSIQMTPLHLAITKERVELIELLISGGADVDAKCAGTTSLHMVASSGKIEL